MAKRINIQMSPIMREVGTKVINPTPTFDPEEYEKALLDIAKKAEIKTISFDDIDEDIDLEPQGFSRPSESQNETGIALETPTNIETGIAFETPTNIETGIALETPTNIETGIVLETPTNIETGIVLETPTNFETGIALKTPTNFETGIALETTTNKEAGFKNETHTNNDTGVIVETPANIETGSKKKGPIFINIDLNSIEREKVPLDCIRLEAIIQMLFKDKKLRIDGWIKLSRETLKAYKINGARLSETRLICKSRGTIDFKIENEGKIGKEKILYKPLK